MDRQQYSQLLSDSNKIYYGYGIGEDATPDVLQPIFEYGLRTSNDNINFATICLSEGSSTLFNSTEQLLNNWPDKVSRRVIIAALPKDYHIVGIVGTSLQGNEQAAYYSHYSLSDAQLLGIKDGSYLRPEFILGMYNSDSKEFIQNSRFISFKSQEEQKDIMNEIKRQYIDVLRGSDVKLQEYFSDYNDLYTVNCPLTDDEIKKADRYWDYNQLKNSLSVLSSLARESEANSIVDTWAKDSKGMIRGEEGLGIVQGVHEITREPKISQPQLGDSSIDELFK